MRCPLSGNKEVRLWSGYADGQAREVCVSSSSDDMYWFSVVVDGANHTVPVTRGELYEILQRRQVVVETTPCSAVFTVEGDEVSFAFYMGERIGFSMELAKLGLLLKSIGLPPPPE